MRVDQRSTIYRFARGGAEIGSGGQGTVFTMDDLPAKTGGWTSMTMVAVKLRENRVIESVVPIQWFVTKVKTMVFKGALAFAEDVDEETKKEFDTNMKIVRTMAERDPDADWSVMEQHTPLIFAEDGLVVIGICAPADAKPDSKNQRWFPLYRRMAANVKSLYNGRLKKELTVETPLKVAVAMLDVLAAMRRVEVFHCDIKEENVLYDDICGDLDKDKEKEKEKDKDTLNKGQKGGDANVVTDAMANASADKVKCRLTFALADYGLARINPVRVSTRGTAGSVAPLMFPPDDSGRDMFLGENSVPDALISGEAIWKSYDGARKTMKNMRESAAVGDRKQTELVAKALEKNDIFAVGIMFTHLEGSDALSVLAKRMLIGAPVPSPAGRQPAVTEGPPIWMIAEAAQACSALLSNTGERSKRLRFTLKDE